MTHSLCFAVFSNISFMCDASITSYGESFLFKQITEGKKICLSVFRSTCLSVCLSGVRLSINLRRLTEGSRPISITSKMLPSCG